MKKVKFTFSMQYVHRDITEEWEYDDDVTDEEIQQDFDTWLSEQYSADWRVIDDKA